MTYNWQNPDWPNFRCEATALTDELTDFRRAHADVRPAYLQIAGSALETEELTREAPPSARVEREVARFTAEAGRFRATGDAVADTALKTALFHVYFESIHPFEDGSSR